MLCLDPKAPDDPTGDPGYPIDPSPIRTKADATTTCHTYLYPEVRMDCSNRGKLLDDWHEPKHWLQRHAELAENTL